MLYGEAEEEEEDKSVGRTELQAPGDPGASWRWASPGGARAPQTRIWCPPSSRPDQTRQSPASAAHCPGPHPHPPHPPPQMREVPNLPFAPGVKGQVV